MAVDDDHLSCLNPFEHFNAFVVTATQADPPLSRGLNRARTFHYKNYGAV